VVSFEQAANMFVEVKLSPPTVRGVVIKRNVRVWLEKGTRSGDVDCRGKANTANYKYLRKQVKEGEPR
jgi:hypothetical protein